MTQPTQRVRDMMQALVDINDPLDLAAMYLELLCGKEVEDPSIENTEEFCELWNDYEMEEVDDGG